LVLGFELLLSEEKPGQEAGLDSSVLMQSGSDSEAAEILKQLAHIRSFGSTERLELWMAEPDVSDPSAWIQWFDDLNASADYLRQESTT
jgi:hypothetical protein